MKGQRIIYGLWLLMACGGLLCSCSKENNGKTIALIGQEEYIDDIEKLFSDFKPAFDAVKEKMRISHEGPIPPKIEGGFVMDNTLLVDSNVGYISNDVTMPEVYLRFKRQHNGLVTLDMKESVFQQSTDTVFVMGDDEGFTVYFKEKREYEQPVGGMTYHATLERGVIMCGSVTPDGLEDFHFASIVMKMEDDSNGLLVQYPPGTYLIYKDGDGMANKCTW